MSGNVEAGDYGAWERERQEYLAALRSMPLEAFSDLATDHLEDWQRDCYQEVKSHRAVGVIRSNVPDKLMHHPV